MKTINNYLLALMSVCMLAWTACTDSVDYDPASELEGQGAYFAAASASFRVEENSGTESIAIYRSTKTGSADISLTVTYGEGVESAVQVPTSVHFADGENAATVNISYNNLQDGQSYALTVAVTDATPYANSSISVSFLYSNEPGYTWEVVSEDAVYQDDIFGIIGMGGIKTEGIVVEKAKEVNQYRFRSPYDNSYFQKTWGGNLFPAGFEFNYIVLDGETYKDANGEPLYYIARTNLGFLLAVADDNSVSVDIDTETQNFGSVAGNLSSGGAPIPPTSTDYPLGTYDKKKKAFNLGATFQYLDGYGYNVSNAGKFMLYLDPSALVPNYDTDYTWMPMRGHGGYFTSELTQETWLQAIQQAAEDETFYRFPNLYAQGTAFYFYLDKEQGSVSILKGQESGLTTFGKPVYIEGTAGKSSYDVETGMLTLGLTFYLADESGKKAAELTKVVETIQLGTEIEGLLTGKSIDDYVGNWVVSVDGQQSGRVLASVYKADESTLVVYGLSATGAEDPVLLDYDAESGLLTFQAQEVAPLSELVECPVLVTPFNSVTGDLTDEETLLGGLTADGQLKFMNSATNEGVWDSMCFIDIEDQKLYLLTGLYNYLDWTPYSRSAAGMPEAIKAQPGMSRMPVSRGITPKRTYKKELNLTPVPVQQTNGSMKMQLIVPENRQNDLF